MFFGRQAQLDELNNAYASGKLEIAVVYGRRRTGKTALISEFTRDKKAIYFIGAETNGKGNLEEFSRTITAQSRKERQEIIYRSFSAALEQVFEMSRQERLILVIDEYQFIDRSAQKFADDLGKVAAKYGNRSKLMIIICGSSMPYMQKNLLDGDWPLSQLVSCRIKVDPFDFADTCRYLGGFSSADKALLYGVTGGMPCYLEQIDACRSVEENIKAMFLTSGSAFCEEPENLIRREVREPALYNAILTAIAGGACHMKDISAKVEEETGVCDKYLKNLIAFELVRREIPYGEKASRKTRYTVSDHMFRFWYRFVPENRSAIACGNTDKAFEGIKPGLYGTYMEDVFKEICRRYINKVILNASAGEVELLPGRWWGTDPNTGMPAEVDIMLRQDGGRLLLGSCCWEDKKTGINDMETLIWKSRMFREENIQLYLFSRCGFTDRCKEVAGEIGNIKLVTYDGIIREMLAEKKLPSH